MDIKKNELLLCREMNKYSFFYDCNSFKYRFSSLII